MQPTFPLFTGKIKIQTRYIAAGATAICFKVKMHAVSASCEQERVHLFLERAYIYV